MPTQTQPMMFDRRSSGLLLHPTSLPGPHGCGDLGPPAHAFADFLSAAGQRWWQMLPVGPPGDGNSPYSATSAFAGHPALISLEHLVEQGLLQSTELRRKPKFAPNRIDHDRGLAFRMLLLRKAFARFELQRIERRRDFRRFIDANAFWLADYVLFAALKNSSGGAPWSDWDIKLRKRDPAALELARRELDRELRFHRFLQFEFDRQWQALRRRCNDRGIGLIGDIPIFVAHDSAEVWANPHLFLLDRSQRPKVVSGSPPDYFSADGQRWGHPHYDWAAHQKQNFRWWIKRFEYAMRRFDAVRIDHFLGFHQVWSIPARSATAKTGRWTRVPGEAFFRALCDELGEIPIIAEDLGSVTPQALALRDQFGFPGMRVLQFGFDEGAEYHLPHNYPRRAVVYTGTHDNDTTAGWFGKLPARTRRRVREYAGLPTNARGLEEPEIAWEMIRLALASVAETAIFPLQDLLGLGSESRMNVPGTTTANWSWRLRKGALTPALARRFREMCNLFERTGNPDPT